MYLKRRHKLHTLVDKTKRVTFTLDGVYFDAAANAMIACDSEALDIVPVELEDDERDSGGGPTSNSVLLPADALKRASAKSNVGANAVARLRLNGVCEVENPVGSEPHTFPINRDSRYPEWRRIIPDESIGKWIDFCIDVELLRKLAGAMGSEQVILRVRMDEDARTNSPLTVYPREYSGNFARGVLMPMNFERPEYMIRDTYGIPSDKPEAPVVLARVDTIEIDVAEPEPQPMRELLDLPEIEIPKRRV